MEEELEIRLKDGAPAYSILVEELPRKTIKVERERQLWLSPPTRHLSNKLIQRAFNDGHQFPRRGQPRRSV